MDAEAVMREGAKRLARESSARLAAAKATEEQESSRVPCWLAVAGAIAVTLGGLVLRWMF